MSSDATARASSLSPTPTSLGPTFKSCGAGGWSSSTTSARRTARGWATRASRPSETSPGARRRPCGSAPPRWRSRSPRRSRSPSSRPPRTSRSFRTTFPPRPRRSTTRRTSRVSPPRRKPPRRRSRGSPAPTRRSAPALGVQRDGLRRGPRRARGSGAQHRRARLALAHLTRARARFPHGDERNEDGNENGVARVGARHGSVVRARGGVRAAARRARARRCPHGAPARSHGGARHRSARQARH